MDRHGDPRSLDGLEPRRGREVELRRKGRLSDEAALEHDGPLSAALPHAVAEWSYGQPVHCARKGLGDLVPAQVEIRYREVEVEREAPLVTRIELSDRRSALYRHEVEVSVVVKTLEQEVLRHIHHRSLSTLGPGVSRGVPRDVTWLYVYRLHRTRSNSLGSNGSSVSDTFHLSSFLIALPRGPNLTFEPVSMPLDIPSARSGLMPETR